MTGMADHQWGHLRYDYGQPGSSDLAVYVIADETCRATHPGTRDRQPDGRPYRGRVLRACADCRARAARQVDW